MVPDWRAARATRSRCGIVSRTCEWVLPSQVEKDRAPVLSGYRRRTVGQGRSVVAEAMRLRSRLALAGFLRPASMLECGYRPTDRRCPLVSLGLGWINRAAHNQASVLQLLHLLRMVGKVVLASLRPSRRLRPPCLPPPGTGLTRVRTLTERL
jgi:hypothetical protein